MKHAWLYSDLLQVLKEEPLSSGFSADGAFIFASAIPHCLREREDVRMEQREREEMRLEQREKERVCV